MKRKEKTETIILAFIVFILCEIVIMTAYIIFIETPSEWNFPEWKCNEYENATYITSEEFDMCYGWCDNTQNATEEQCYQYCNELFPVEINGTCIEQYYSRSLRR